MSDTTTTTLGQIEYEGEKFDVIKRPNALLIADITSPQGIRYISKFLTVTLGVDGHNRLRDLFDKHDADENDLETIVEQIATVSTGRPTS